MESFRQNDIADWLGVSAGYLSQLFKEDRHLSWQNAHRIAGIIDMRPETVIAASGDNLRKLLYRKYRAAKRKQEREAACA
jgi:plasmid maintenance system antidote protein VapI